jgi:hypothetical protein
MDPEGNGADHAEVNLIRLSSPRSDSVGGSEYKSLPLKLISPRVCLMQTRKQQSGSCRRNHGIKKTIAVRL